MDTEQRKALWARQAELRARGRVPESDDCAPHRDDPQAECAYTHDNLEWQRNRMRFVMREDRPPLHDRLERFVGPGRIHKPGRAR